jgi:hypothetical protein
VDIHNIIVAIVVSIAITVSSAFALVNVPLLVAAASIDLLHPALVVVILFFARPGDLSFLLNFRALDELVCRLSLADYDGLHNLFPFPDNNGLWRRWGFVSDVNRLR